MSEPPRLAERLLQRILGSGDRGDAVLGDLREEYARRLEGSAAGARLWYGMEAMRLVVQFAMDRILRTVRRGTPREATTGIGPGETMREVGRAIRRLTRSPVFAAIAVITLGLGIGVNAGAFALVDAMAFRPVPVRDADRLVAMFTMQGDSRYQDFSYQDYLDYRDGLPDVMAALAGYNEGPVSVSVRDGSGAVMAWRHMVTPGFFDVLRARVAAGRLLRDDDVNAVVLSHGFWLRRFAGDRSVVGRTIRLNGHEFTVVGVTARGFTGSRLFSYAPEIFVPIAAIPQVMPGARDWLESRSGGWLGLIGRMRADVDAVQVRAVADAVAEHLGATFPSTHSGRRIELLSNERPINPWAFTPSQLRAVGLTTVAGVGLVLLIACANVISLQLARATARRREIAVRMSLGAGRSLIVRDMITESLLLSTAGGMLGLAIAAGFVRLSAVFTPPLDFAAAYTPGVDVRVLAYTLLAAMVAGLMAGLFPAIRETRADPARALRAEGGGAARRSRLLDGLVVAQMTFSLVALVGAGLFYRSLSNARRLDPGFPLERGLVLTVDPGLQGYAGEDVKTFYDRLQLEMRALPGVVAVSRASLMPLDGNSESTRVAAEGRIVPVEERQPASYYAVDPGFFSTLGVRVIEGREFRDSDDPSDPARAVINRTLAAQIWPGESSVGKRIVVGAVTADIIGVVEDTKLKMLRDGAQPMIALDLRQRPRTQTTLLIRTAGDPMALAGDVRRVLESIDPALALIGLKTLAAQTRYTLSGAQSGAVGGMLFGGLAVLLAAAGLFGVVSYGAARASREIGIRMALGARRVEVVGMIVKRGIRLTSIGLAVGLVASVGLARSVASLLYGVSPVDPVAFTVGSIALLIVALVACWIPAVRAARTDPLAVLRND